LTALFPVVWTVVGPTETKFLSIPIFSPQVFSCPLPQSSEPQASVSWTGPQLVANGNGVGVSQDGRLVFSAYSPADRGSLVRYTCTVTNAVSGESAISKHLDLLDQSSKW